LRLWHDNSGQGDNASWFLKLAVVKDLQTNEKFTFICNKWFAVEKDDGKIDRLIFVANKEQRTEFKYLLQKQAKLKFSDGHLWFSIVGRPTFSSFSRMDRVTCVFVLLYLTMLMNILYYQVAKSNTSNGLQIGPLFLSVEQVGFLYFGLFCAGQCQKFRDLINDHSAAN
jgi:polycystin 1L2